LGLEDAILNHFRVDERRLDVRLVVVPEVVHRYGRPKVAGPKEAIASTVISEKARPKFFAVAALCFRI